MTDWISWAATAATIAAACMTASNLGARITGYGFAVFTVGSLCWLAFGLTTDQRALVWTNIVLTGLNLFGVWRWLGVRAKIEEGGRSAQKDSEATPGEALFPGSLLGRGTIVGSDGAELGRAVDAMIGCSSGRLAYIVAAEGGLAGVGETLRKVSWVEVSVEEDRFQTRMSPGRFRLLPALDKDAWPG